LEALATPPAARRPELWDGHAGDRIAEVIVTGGTAADRLRPTDRGRRPDALTMA